MTTPAQKQTADRVILSGLAIVGLLLAVPVIAFFIAVVVFVHGL